MIEYQCKCGTEYVLDDRFLNQTVECYKCNARHIIKTLPHDLPIKISQESIPALPSIMHMLRNSLKRYRKRFTVLFPISLIGTISTQLMLIALKYLGFWPSPYFSNTPTLFLLIKANLLFILFYLFCLTQGALYGAVIQSRAGIMDSFKLAQKKIYFVMGIGLITLFLLTGGYLLFALPGIYYTVLICFTPFLIFADDIRGLDAMMLSRSYVQDHWVPIFARISVIGIAFAFMTKIPWLGWVLNALLFPVVVLYADSILHELKRKAGPAITRDIPRASTLFYFLTFFGIMVYVLGGGIYGLSVIKGKNLFHLSKMVAELDADLHRPKINVNP